MAKICPECNTKYEQTDKICPKCRVTLVILAEGDSIIGKIIDDRFQIMELLGTGGMGSVYKAYQVSVDREIALKVLKTDFAKDLNLIKRFMREAKATSKLDHPNIVTIFDFGQTEDGLLYIAMEFLKGKPLTNIIRNEGLIPYQRAFAIGLQVCSALSEAHKKDIVHRDLKPDNIFITKKIDHHEFVKVLDFGIAKIVSGDVSMELTQSGQIFGTPHYMSPEQAQGKQLDGRSDLFSLGIILYEMLSGKRPFIGDTPTAVLLKVINDPVPPFREINPAVEVPQKIESLLMRMLEKEPEKRPKTAAEVSEELLTFITAPYPQFRITGSQISIRTKTEQASGLQDGSVIPPTSVLFKAKDERLRVQTEEIKEDVDEFVSQPPVGTLQEEIGVTVLLDNKESGFKQTSDAHNERNFTTGKATPIPYPQRKMKPIFTIPTVLLVGAIIVAGILYFTRKEDDNRINLVNTERHPVASESESAKPIPEKAPVLVLEKTSPAIPTEKLEQKSDEKFEEKTESPLVPALMSEKPLKLYNIIIGSEPEGADVFKEGEKNKIGSTPLLFKFNESEKKVSLILKSEGFTDYMMIIEATSLKKDGKDKFVAKLKKIKPAKKKKIKPEKKRKKEEDLFDKY